MNKPDAVKKPLRWKTFSVLLLLVVFWIVGLPLSYNLYWIYYTPRGERYRTVGADVEYLDRGEITKGRVVESDISLFLSRSIVTLDVRVEQVPQVRVDEFGNTEIGGGFGGTVDPYFGEPGYLSR